MQDKKILVAYFSASGTHLEMAKYIAKSAGADIFEIRPEVPYSAADLDWNDKHSRSTLEMTDPHSRPAMVGKARLEDCDTVLVGFPIWWYVAPTIIDTFLESGDFSGKTIALFATSGSSGMGKTEQVLKPLVSGSAKWLPGKRLGGKRDADEWLKSLGL